MATAGFSAEWVGVGEAAAKLKELGLRVDAAARRNVIEGAAALEHAAKDNFEGSHAKGEPHVGGDKPNVVSGTLRRSIRSSGIDRIGFSDYSTLVGPTAVYGRAVEYGYHGTDARGRHHNQRAFPYMTPAVHEVREKLLAIAERNWATVLR